MLSRALIFTTTLFLGSFLMFLLEPMVAKMLLPVLGGAPMVWNTCLLFFQVSLLSGYAYAHLASRWLGTRWHATTYVALLVLAWAFLPITIRSDTSAAAAGPAVWLLVALTGSIGLPFLALAACAPSLQHWFSESDHPAARDPYFLYAASNAGSLLALLAFTGVVEPLLPLEGQRTMWAAGFAAFVILTAACVVLTWRLRAQHPPRAVAVSNAEPSRRASVSWGQRLRWTALACVPSSLLLAVTSYVSTDIAAVPLLWIVPLSIYLLTFVVAFGWRSAAWDGIAARDLPVFITALAVFLAAGVGGPLWLVMPMHLVTFALAALACHGALAEERPAPSLLTEYYFWLAFGGMLGGFFNTFLAPLLFNAVVEYPLALLAAAALSGRGRSRCGTPIRPAEAGFPVAVGVLTAALLLGVRQTEAVDRLVLPALGVPALIAFSQSARPARFALCLGAMIATASLVWSPYGHVLRSERTFFGMYRVTADAAKSTHSLYHGTTLHGVQALDGPDRGEPLTYYHRAGPFGQAFGALPALSRAPEVAVIGLGIGSLAAYAGADQRWTFYEIDPAVERLARTPELFTHLNDCGTRCRVVLGDARLLLAGATGQQYGVLVLDAFSSDAIPVHLVTREAVALYLSRLTTDGVLAFHVSNRHLTLSPMLANLAADAGLVAVEQFHRVTPDEVSNDRSGSHWVMMARNSRTIEPLLRDARWTRLASQPSAPLWTDDFSNILSVLKF